MLAVNALLLSCPCSSHQRVALLPHHPLARLRPAALRSHGGASFKLVDSCGTICYLGTAREAAAVLPRGVAWRGGLGGVDSQQWMRSASSEQANYAIRPRA